jgi:KEOPS complex subunit Cgi121
MRENRFDAIDCCIIQFEIEIDEPDSYLGKVRQIGNRFGVHIVLFNAEMMAGMSHVCSALKHAFRAFDRGTAISNSPEMEALLYASGTRQCRSGLRFGIHPGKNRVYLCICPENRKALEDLLKDGIIVHEDWNILSPEKVKRLTDQFGITQEELEVSGRDRITDLILERVALLEVYR